MNTGSPYLSGAADPALDVRYTRFFACFNQQKFFEAHEVLEDLWLKVRHETDGNFYKGLIQLAGAFVHVQKRRQGPAQSLLRLARANLGYYPATYKNLDVEGVCQTIHRWERKLESLPEVKESALTELPVLELLPGDGR